MHINYSACVLLLLAGGGVSQVKAASPSVSVMYGGNLVAEPCIIMPGDEDIHLDFGNIVDKYLYLNKRTPSQALDIRLAECDLSIGKTVNVTFIGMESTELPGLLAIAGTSVAKGIAIGLETAEGKPLPFNTASDKYPLQADNSVISLKAYVEGEPKAIADKTITRGEFRAVATFSLEYE